MRLLVVNPNTSASMTQRIGAAARAAAGPVVDGAAAVKLAEALVGLSLANSKLGPYARPRPKTFTGAFAGLSRAL
jgi:allantoin racemase